MKTTLRVIVLAAAVFLLLSLCACGNGENRPVVYDNVRHYAEYITAADDSDKWGMDEAIFPAELPTDATVEEFHMVYYDPWDAQWVTELVLRYDDAAAYDAEVGRLRAYPSTEYLGNYGVTGFAEGRDLLAMYADPYYGFVYAVTDGTGRIAYVELIFCNYFLDVDWTAWVEPEFLPVGFDASSDNAYRHAKLEEEKGPTQYSHFPSLCPAEDAIRDMLDGEN